MSTFTACPMGHSRRGEVQDDDPELLPEHTRRPAGVRRQQPSIAPIPRQVGQ